MDAQGLNLVALGDEMGMLWQTGTDSMKGDEV